MKATYAKYVKSTLLSIIHEMSLSKNSFVKNPSKDFTRNRKLHFESIIKLILFMNGSSLFKELIDYFDCEVDTPTVSAFSQQRSKLLPETFEFLFHEFNKRIDSPKLFHKYRLIICDGSKINIPHNPSDSSTYFRNNQSARGFNRLHFNALFDLLNKNYIDAIIQPGHKSQECRSCIQMMERLEGSDPVILIADRGYENYNLFAHAQAKGWKYLIRVKDVGHNGIVSGLLDQNGCFDKEFSLSLSRRRTKERKSKPETNKFLSNAQDFDFLPVGEQGTYPITFRVIRLEVTENQYEVLITNLSKEAFCVKTLKELYELRWGIETSFRELKYTIGLANLHTKKVDCIFQEIFARITLYNFCETITNHVVIRQHKGSHHLYQVNFARAIYICKYYLKKKISPPNIELMIQKNILPIRPDRHPRRKIRSKEFVSFLYRVG